MRSAFKTSSQDEQIAKGSYGCDLSQCDGCCPRIESRFPMNPYVPLLVGWVVLLSVNRPYVIMSVFNGKKLNLHAPIIALVLSTP